MCRPEIGTMDVWSVVIALCLCHLSAGFMINLERQHSYIDLVGGPTDNTAEVTQDDLQRNRPSILEAVGQGIGGFVISWLGPLASGVGSVLGGIGSSLVTTTPRGPTPSPNNAVTEPFSDVTNAVDNERSDETPSPDTPPVSQHDAYQYGTEETKLLTISTLESPASL